MGSSSSFHAPAPGPFPRPKDEVRLTITVEDLAKTTQFYSEGLGFYGGPARQETAKLRVPGDGFPVDFSAPKYVERKPVHSEIHDPGSGVLRLRVVDFNRVVKTLTSAGATIVSAGGEPVNLGRNRAVILRDINNLFLQVLESAPPATQ